MSKNMYEMYRQRWHLPKLRVRSAFVELLGKLCIIFQRQLTHFGLAASRSPIVRFNRPQNFHACSLEFRQRLPKSYQSDRSPSTLSLLATDIGYVACMYNVNVIQMSSVSARASRHFKFVHFHNGTIYRLNKLSQNYANNGGKLIR